MNAQERIEWTQEWRRTWNAVRDLAYIGDDQESWLTATKELLTASHKLHQLPPPDRQALNEVQLRIKLDCASDSEELPKA
jgi:hypothetical protein